MPNYHCNGISIKYNCTSNPLKKLFHIGMKIEFSNVGLNLLSHSVLFNYRELQSEHEVIRSTT